MSTKAETTNLSSPSDGNLEKIESDTKNFRGSSIDETEAQVQ
jgi:hypothetical protein